MKVLVVTHSYYPAFKQGGPVISLHNLNKSLQSLGVDISVVTTNAGLENNRQIQLNTWLNIDNVKVKYFAYYGVRFYNISPRMAGELFTIIKEFDLVYITPVWNFPNVIGAISSVLNRKPYILSPRGTLYKETIGMKSKKFKEIYYSIVVKKMISHAARLHFTSQHEKTNTMDYHGLAVKSFVVPNGLDLSSFEILPEKGCFKRKYNQLKDKKYILFLGRINSKKGLDILIHAFKNISKMFKDLHLVIAGFDNEGYLNYIKGLVQYYNLSGKVVFPGSLQGEDKLEAYVDAELFVLSSYSENFGMTVVEAMASGCPVVISENVGVGDQVKELDMCSVVKCNSESLTKGIAEMLENSDLNISLQEKTKKYIKDNFNSSVIAYQMLSEYERLLN